MSRAAEADFKIRFLRALAFEIRRKRPPADALAECIEREGASGRHRALRPATTALEADGFVAALRAVDFVGAEAAAVLTAVLEAPDPRLLATAINNLADFLESEGQA